MARNTSSPNQKPRNPDQVLETKLRQDQIQAACLRAIELTDRAHQPLSTEEHSALQASLSELIQQQQDLENELGRLQLSFPSPPPDSLVPLWWQAAELETLIYGFHQALQPPSD